jgi:NAD(P)H-hydrate epimerase
MQRAGRAAFNLLARRWPSAGSVTVFCGRGNNAGDGYLVAGLAREQGFDVQLFQVGEPPERGDAARALTWAAARRVAPDPDGAPIRGAVVVDALLGTGLRDAPRPAFAAAIDRINGADRPVLALDVPSGVATDTGAVPGAVVRADVTISFLGEKIGLRTGPALDWCGSVVHDRLGVSDELIGAASGWPLIHFDPASLPARSVNAHKRAVGHLVVIGGDLSMGGAVMLAAEAGLRTGVGLVTIVTRAEHAGAVLARRPELMVREAGDRTEVEALLARASALVLGPGLGRTPWGRGLLEQTLAAARPTLIDADGLRLLGGLLRTGGQRKERQRTEGARTEGARALPAQLIITPHPGEAAALLDSDSATVNGDRCAAAIALASEFGAVAILKGAGSVLADPAGPVGILAQGNPGMATAGMGDVLSGIVGGWLAQGLDARAAAVVGASLHAAAGDLAARQVGRRGLVAGDVTGAMIELLRRSD